MRKWQAVLILTVIVMTLLLCTGFAENNLAPWFDAAEKLAYHTYNVTISGSAEFSLDGKRFKTAEITYQQDRKNSFWQEKLFTPMEWTPDKESGFTVIQSDRDIYVMEKLQPGIYRRGTDAPQDTLFRRSPLSDLLFAMGRTAADQLTALSGIHVVMTENGDGTKDLQLETNAENVSPLLSYIANLALRLTGNRLFGIDADTPVIPDGYYSTVTPTRIILYESKSLTLDDCHVHAQMNERGRLTALNGTINARLTGYFQDYEYGEFYLDEECSERTLTIRFSAELGSYGTTAVSHFDPDAYGVTLNTAESYSKPVDTPKIVLTDEQYDSFLMRTEELCHLAGYPKVDKINVMNVINDSGYVFAEAEIDGQTRHLIFNTDGLLLAAQYDNPLWNQKALAETVLSEDMEQWIMNYLREANPELPVGGLHVDEEFHDGTDWIMDLTILDTNGEASTDIMLIVRWLPEWRIEDYTCIGHG